MPPELRDVLNYIAQRIAAREWILTSPYGRRRNPITGAEEFHNGIDLAPTPRAPREIYIPRAGRVLFGESPHKSTSGLQVLWYVGDYALGFAHLKSIALAEKYILRIGNTGLSTGVHLHLTFMHKSVRGYETEDPLKILDALNKSTT